MTLAPESGEGTGIRMKLPAKKPRLPLRERAQCGADVPGPKNPGLHRRDGWPFGRRQESRKPLAAEVRLRDREGAGKRGC